MELTAPPPAAKPSTPPSVSATASKINAPTVALSSQRTRHWTKLRKLRVVGASKVAKIKVSCVGSSCPKSKRALKLSDLVGRKLKPGTRVTIKVGSHTIKITIRATRAPLVTVSPAGRGP